MLDGRSIKVIDRFSRLTVATRSIRALPHRRRNVSRASYVYPLFLVLYIISIAMLCNHSAILAIIQISHNYNINTVHGKFKYLTLIFPAITYLVIKLHVWISVLVRKARKSITYTIRFAISKADYYDKRLFE